MTASLTEDALHAEERAKEEGWRWDGFMGAERELVGLIYALILSTKPEVVVETGTYQGVTTEAMAEALETNNKGHLWTVENEPELAAQYAKMKMTRTTFINADSADWTASAAPGNIDFAFVDCGDPPVRLSVVRNLYPRMEDDGLMLVHDTRFYEGFLTSLKDILGAPQLHLPMLHGLGVWQT